ncbi:hypothetical protein L7F22_035277 [Adiantum nelumboides]|nr:hypothetical protein [Adiantum nelumboides]
MAVIMIIMWGAVQVCSGEDPCPSSTVTDCYELASCLPATKDENVQPTSGCCSKVKEIGSFYPDCLCACVTYRLARLMGVKPAIALSIPKRCQIEARPVGYECAGNNPLHYSLNNTNLIFFLLYPCKSIITIGI